MWPSGKTTYWPLTVISHVILCFLWSPHFQFKMCLLYLKIMFRIKYYYFLFKFNLQLPQIDPHLYTQKRLANQWKKKKEKQSAFMRKMRTNCVVKKLKIKLKKPCQSVYPMLCNQQSNPLICQYYIGRVLLGFLWPMIILKIRFSTLPLFGTYRGWVLCVTFLPCL
jgi:hypothetical protein